MEWYVLKDNQRLRCGYTTGTCAAAAAQRAAAMVLGASFSPEDKIVLTAPKGVRLELDALDPEIGEGWASCAVRKDAGDDPDITNGILVYARVSKADGGTGPRKKEREALRTGVTVLRESFPRITLDGGIGVGRVTKRGLSCPVGEAAINPVPRRMILEQVLEVCEEFDYEGSLHVEISVPGGEEIARKTFNPQLGVLGGISILGTSGIVEPMSDQALVDTIKVKMDVRKADGAEYLVITPGNYGEAFFKTNMALPDIDTIKCGNFIGEALDYAEHSGFKGVLMVGHIGKLIKVAAGIMNTHSRYGDARMEILGAHAALAGAAKETIKELLACVTMEDAISVLDRAGIRERTLQSVLNKLDFHIKERVHHSMEIGAMIFSNHHGYLGETADAPLLRERLSAGARREDSEIS